MHLVSRPLYRMIPSSVDIVLRLLAFQSAISDGGHSVVLLLRTIGDVDHAVAYQSTFSDDVDFAV